MPGTNAVYTFKKAGENGYDVHVYDNCDAYPEGAASKLRVAYEQSKTHLAKRSLPKTRAMANSLAVGDIPDTYEQLVLTPNWRDAPGTNYRYEIRDCRKNVHVKVMTPDCSKLPDNFRLEPGRNFPLWNVEFQGSLRKFIKWANGKNFIGA